jgi:hypothetical protein
VTNPQDRIFPSSVCNSTLNIRQIYFDLAFSPINFVANREIQQRCAGLSRPIPPETKRRYQYYRNVSRKAAFTHIAPLALRLK